MKVTLVLCAVLAAASAVPWHRGRASSQIQEEDAGLKSSIDFSKAMINKRENPTREEEEDRKNMVFNFYDIDGNGLITREEVRLVVGREVTQQDWEKRIKGVDVDGNFKISKSEFIATLSANTLAHNKLFEFGLEPDARNVQIQEEDAGLKSSIDFSKAMMNKRENPTREEEEKRKDMVFNFYDIDSNGLITREEVRLVVGREVTQKDWEKRIKGVDMDGDFKISKSEFSATLTPNTLAKNKLFQFGLEPDVRNVQIQEEDAHLKRSIDFSKATMNKRKNPTTEEQKKRKNVVFMFYDIDGDGNVTREEVRLVVGRDVTEKDWKERIKDVDVDKDFKISKSEFFATLTANTLAHNKLFEFGLEPDVRNVQIQEEDTEDLHGRSINLDLRSLPTKQRAEARKRMVFTFYDIDDDGFITLHEVAAVVGRRISQEEWDERIQEVDVDGDERVNFNEFAATLTPETMAHNTLFLFARNQ